MNNQSEKIELYISCRNLRDLDVFSKSDPYVKVSYRRDFTQNQYSVLGKSILMQAGLRPFRTSSIRLTRKLSNLISSLSPDRTSGSISSTTTETGIMTISLEPSRLLLELWWAQPAWPPYSTSKIPSIRRTITENWSSDAKSWMTLMVQHFLFRVFPDEVERDQANQHWFILWLLGQERSLPQILED